MLIATQAQGAAAWASYLINGDSSGICGRERALADAWVAEHGEPVDCDDDSHFSWEFGAVTGWGEFGVNGGELLTYHILVDEMESV